MEKVSIILFVSYVITDTFMTEELKINSMQTDQIV